MKNLFRKPSARARGAAAIELALVLPILVVVMAPMFLYARYMWHYTVAQKAAQDAARYMSTVSAAEMKSMVLAGYARDIAIQVAKREVAQLAPGNTIPDASISCDNHACAVSTGEVPATVSVFISFRLRDTFFGMYMGPYGIPIKANVTMPYVGK